MLEEIIETLNKEEQLEFRDYLNAKNKRKDNKGIGYFDQLVRERNSVNFKKKERLTNLQRATRKRLVESLVYFLAFRDFNENNKAYMECLVYVHLLERFLKLNKYRVANFLLKKIESSVSLDSNLDLKTKYIRLKIRFAHSFDSWDLDSLQREYKEAVKLRNTEDALELVYASVRKLLNTKDNVFTGSSFDRFIKAELEAYNVELKEVYSYRFLYHFLFLANEFAYLEMNYHEVENFALSKFIRLEEQNIIRVSEGYYHLYCLYFIANLHFRNKRFQFSWSYLEQMHTLMRGEYKKYATIFKLKCAILSGFCLSYSGKNKDAIDLIKESLILNKKGNLEEILDAKLLYCCMLSWEDDYIGAMRVLKDLYHTDKWLEERKGRQWIIKKSLIEMIIHFELENTELVISRIISFRKRYRDWLVSLKEFKVLDYLRILDKMTVNMEDNLPLLFREMEEKYQDDLNRNVDIFVLTFYTWMKSKIENKKFYTVLLLLVNNGD